MEMILDPWELGTDRIARGAPCLIMGYAKKDNRTALPAVTIAIAHIQLAANALGLGTCLAGYFNQASQVYQPLQQAIGLPERYILWDIRNRLSSREIPTDSCAKAL
jgi:nitroreductase